MANKKPKAKRPGKPGPNVAANEAAKTKASPKKAEAFPTSFLRVLDRSLKGGDRAILFSAVVERLQTRLLTQDEANLVSGWFESLASGKDPKKVFMGETRGRPKGSNSNEFLKGQDIALPDHVDLCWTIRSAIAKTGDEDHVFRVVAKHFGKTEDHLRRLYARILPTLADDPEIVK